MDKQITVLTLVIWQNKMLIGLELQRGGAPLKKLYSMAQSVTQCIPSTVLQLKLVNLSPHQYRQEIT
uniref:Uncharacterized protein n=1 Tax=Pseudoalteromonas rubra TaxID=43658 RepID=A0A0F4QXY5_9GAMM|nr:hypothetical protein TW77_03875 [Pseudoalteromonas rubra]